LSLSPNYEDDLRRTARGLSDIAHTLESADASLERARRALVLVAQVVPYRRCALLWAFAGEPPELLVVPEPPAEQRAELLKNLTRVLQLVTQAEEIGRSADELPHLTLPLMGLDEIIGLIRVEPAAGTTYEVHDLRLLSVVAAQLGSYLAMIRMRALDARRTQEIANSRDFQQLLLGVVSHDLRTPLTVVTTVASTLLRKSSEPKTAEALQRVLRNAAKADRIINDLLDVTHVRVTGELSLDRRRVELRGLVQDVVDDLQLSHPDRQVPVTLPGEEIVGEWDPNRLTQLLVNLLNNALQHGAQDTPVELVVSVNPDAVVLSVHNQGAAIPPSVLTQIFDPFRRGGQGARRAGGGLGLGLYIVDQIARAHGARASMRSSEAEGTTVTVTFPKSAVGVRTFAGSAPTPSAAHRPLPGSR